MRGALQFSVDERLLYPLDLSLPLLSLGDSEINGRRHIDVAYDAYNYRIVLFKFSRNMYALKGCDIELAQPFIEIVAVEETEIGRTYALLIRFRIAASLKNPSTVYSTFKPLYVEVNLLKKAAYRGFL